MDGMFRSSEDKQRIDDLTLRVLALEQTVETLYREMGLEQPPAVGVRASEAVHALIREGKPIQAIKQLRVETGLGLRAAKQVVDQLQQQ